MEKDINTEVSNTQLPATEEKANLKESLRIQKSQWIKEQIKRQKKRISRRVTFSSVAGNCVFETSVLISFSILIPASFVSYC